MTKVYFDGGRYVRHEGNGYVSYNPYRLKLSGDDFMLFGYVTNDEIVISRGSLDVKNATTENYRSVIIMDGKSKVENVKNINAIRIEDSSSLFNSNTNKLEVLFGKNIIGGTVSAKTVTFGNGTLNIIKDAVLKVPDKNALDFSKISGEGRIYSQKNLAYYDTKNNFLRYEADIDLSTLNAGDNNEAFSFDGSTLVLKLGIRFNLSGDKPAFIICNDGVIKKANITGSKLINMKGNVEELHLSNNAKFSLNGDLEKAVIDKGSMLTLFKPVDFTSLSGEGFVNINGVIYDTSGHALNKISIDLYTLNVGDSSTAFSFDGATLTLNEGYKITLFGDKAINIVNNASVAKADITGTQLKSITGNGTIEELLLSTNANPVINTKIEHIYPLDLNLNALENSNGSLYSFDGAKLVLNKGYEFSLSGDKPVFITNNGVILEANINGKSLKSITGSGSIKELHLSNNAEFSLSNTLELEKAVIEKGSMLYLYKPVDFSKLSGEGLVNINGVIYDTSGHALNNAGKSFQENIVEYNAKIADAIEKVKAQKYSYVDKAQQEKNVELLNIEMLNNDNLI